MTARFAIVPVELDNAMVDAAQEEINERVKVGCGIYASDLWQAFLSAVPDLIDEQVDDLCRMMWRHDWQWSGSASQAKPALLEQYRNEDRARMRAFLQRLQGKA